MNAAEGLYEICEAAGIFGGATNWKGTIGTFTTDAQQLCFMAGAGRAPEVKVAINYPTVQVLARGDAAPNGRAALHSKMLEVFNLLHAIPQNPTEFPELTSCLARGDIQDLGRDENQRPLASLNFNLIVTPSSAGNRA